MEFYRIEKNGKGPYNPGTNSPRIMEFLTKYQGIRYDDRDGSFSKYMENRPTCNDDKVIRNFLLNILLSKRDEYVYGFDTLEKLLKWFDEYDQMKFLKDGGYMLNLYETEDYCISDYQMIANRTSIKLIESISL